MKLSELKNIGAEIEKKLLSVGISNAEELKNLGSKEAFLRLRQRHPDICLCHLYALQGAVVGERHHLLPEVVKKELKAFNDELKLKS